MQLELRRTNSVSERFFAEFQRKFSIMARCVNLLLRDNTPSRDDAPIENLPDELLIEIFKYLSLEELLQCEDVCLRWNKLARDKALWRPMLIICSGQLGAICGKTLELINNHSKCIHRLKMQYILNYPMIKSITQKCNNLTSLELIMCRLEIEFEDDIKKWPNLKKLNLKNSLLKSTIDLKIQFDQFQHLTFLGLSDFGLSDVNCESLLNCPHLCHIMIEKIRFLTLDFVKRLIKKKQHMLVSLHLNGAEAIDDECLLMLSQCPTLKDLAVIRCDNLSDKGLMHITKSDKLEQLQLWNNESFSEIALKKALGCPTLIKLKSLSLSRIKNISPVIVDVISEYYKSLKFLALYQCPKILYAGYGKQLKTKFRNIDVVLY